MAFSLRVQPPAKALPELARVWKGKVGKMRRFQRAELTPNWGCGHEQCIHLPFVMSRRASSLDCVCVFLRPKVPGILRKQIFREGVSSFLER